jgi:spermidine synthase
MTRGLTTHAAFLAAGLAATAAQVVLLRELVVDVAGDEAAIGVGLAAWLVGIAAGASLARRRRASLAARDAAAGLALLGLLPVLGVLGGRILRHALAPGPGELPGVGLALALAAATLAPPGAAVGWTFTALAGAASRIWQAGEGIARLYVTESIGSLLGGVLVTLLAGPVLSPLLLVSLVGLGACSLSAAASRSGIVTTRPPIVAAAGALALVAVSGPLDRWSEAARFAGTAPGVPLRAAVDTPYQHVDLGGSEVTDVYTSGQYAGSFPDPWGAESLGNLVSVLTPEPGSVLLVGGWERGLVPVLLRHPVRELILLEPDARLFDFLRARLPEADRRALADPRVLVVHDDPRRFIAHGRRSGQFDLVLLLGPEPATLLRARLATVEFFRLVASRLRPRGTLVTAVTTAPAALAGETASLAGSLFRSLREAFPVVRATPGPDTLLVAGLRPEAATLDPGALARRWAERRVRSASFDGSLLPVLLDPERVAATEAALAEAAADATASHDDRPVSFLHALARRQQTTAGPGGRLVAAASRLPAPFLAVVVFLPSLLVVAHLPTGAGHVARRRAAAASHAVAVTGAAGIGWSLLVLFSFQTQAGALYGQLGTLTAVFMLGLAVGATLARRMLAVAWEQGGAGRDAAPRVLRLWLAAALGFAAALPATLHAAGLATRGGAGVALMAHGLLLLAAGTLTGAVFPAAAECRLAAGEGAGEVAGRLEAADHLGAAAAALAGAVLLVPILGIALTAWLLAGLLAVALAVVPRPAR